MSGFLSKLSTIQKFLTTLTWKKIAQVSIFTIILATSWTVFQAREYLYGYFISPKLPISSAVVVRPLNSAHYLEDAVVKSELIVGVQVVITDFQTNSRYAIFTFADNPEMAKIYQKFASEGLVQFPIFNNDLINNQRMVELINGDFTCAKWSETVGSKVIPDAGKYLDTQCSIGISPSYGKFVGYINIYTNRPPTPEEVDLLRTLIKNLAKTVYENDFK